MTIKESRGQEIESRRGTHIKQLWCTPSDLQLIKHTGLIFLILPSYNSLLNVNKRLDRVFWERSISFLVCLWRLDRASCRIPLRDHGNCCSLEEDSQCICDEGSGQASVKIGGEIHDLLCSLTTQSSLNQESPTILLESYWICQLLLQPYTSTWFSQSRF